MPQFLSSIACTGIYLVYKYSHRKQSRGFSQVSVQARKLELNICDQSSIQDNFQTANVTLHNYNVVENHYAETPCENVYCSTHLLIVHFSVSEENKVNRGHYLMLVKCEDL
jgi:hypothetical protein